MRDLRIGRFGARSLSLAAAAGAALAAAEIQRRHVRHIAGDPEYARLSAPMDGRPLHITSADGTILYAEAFGPSDGPPLVLVHGWTEDLRYWTHVIRGLSTLGLRSIAYDLRGHGRSGRAPDEDYSLVRFGQDVEAVLAASITAGERAIVVGHSLGAMSLAAWAEHHDVEERTRAAALVNTGLSGLVAESLLFPAVSRWLGGPLGRRVFLGSRARIPSFSSPLQHAAIRYVAFGPKATPGQVAFYERMLISCPPEVRAAAGIAMSDMDLDHAVARLTVPTLVVAGADDKLTPPAHSMRIAENLPNLARLVELPDTGHMSALESPSELTAALSELVTALTTSSSVATA